MDSKLDKRPPTDTRKIYPVGSSDYRLLEEVGRGVSAVVYRAKCIPFSDYVAIKALDLDRCNSNLDDIRREAQTMSLINHPNVIKAHCSFVVERSLWVVMPYMAGGSCLHIMKSAYPDGFDEPIIASFLKETLKALEYLHNQGHIHRDVKAGNILVDSNGLIKLGDFGVSACMFESGDRKRSRNTFVGTPCWMAPEVMEQSHGYDFKADIWSFGITALELAHGHAPFSKYPPMKVLLMTLQNAPPGLDYERDKRFSKAFKEMIAMCLVKDPKKRPTAEKLLKHSFFKHAKSAEYVARTIVAALPPLWERVNDLKMKEAACLAQKKVPYDEQEERSQNEYKRGVSSWNFDLEALKAEAALNEMDSFSEKNDADGLEIKPPSLPSPKTSSSDDVETVQQPETSHLIKADENVGGEQVTEVEAGFFSTTNASKLEDAAAWKKRPKHYGRFDVFEADPDQDSASSTVMLQSTNKEIKGAKDFVPGVNEGEQIEMEGVVTENAKESKVELKSGNSRRHKEEECSLVFSRADCNDMREDSESHAARKVHDSTPRMPRLGKTMSFNGIMQSPSSTMDAPLLNGVSGFSRPNGQKDDEKLKVPVIQKKGRFSVTAHDMEFQEGLSSLNARRNASTQTSLHKSASVSDGLVERRNQSGSSVSSQSSPIFSNAAIIMPQLQNLFNQTMVQQELIISLMNNINTSEQHPEKISAYRSNGFGNRSFGRSNTINTGELLSDKERELIKQIADLQNRVTTVFDELQAARSRNVQLERQLNAIYNREEEERTQREDAMNEDG